MAARALRAVAGTQYPVLSSNMKAAHPRGLFNVSMGPVAWRHRMVLEGTVTIDMRVTVTIDTVVGPIDT